MIPRLGSPGEGNGNPLQYSCLGNPVARGARQNTICAVARVRHDIGTKPPPPPTVSIFSRAYLSWVLSLVICLFVTFARFLIGLFGGFFTVEALYTPGTNPLLTMWFANTFSQHAAFPSILLREVFTEQELQSWYILAYPLGFFAVTDSAFDVKSNN